MKILCTVLLLSFFVSSCSTTSHNRTISSIVTLDSPMTELPKNTIFKLKHFIEIKKIENMAIWFDNGFLSEIQNKKTGCYLLLNNNSSTYKINPGEFKLLNAELAPHNPNLKNAVKKVQITLNNSSHIYGIACKFLGNTPTIRQFTEEIKGSFELFSPNN